MRISNLSFLLTICLLAFSGLAQDLNPPVKPNSAPEYVTLRHITLSGETVAVNSLVLKRDLAIFKFNQGTFQFVAPVNGKITGAVFVGEGTLSIDPISAPERRSLSLLTKDNEFVEHFHNVVLRFTDGTADEIRKGASGNAQASATAAGLLHDSLEVTRTKLHYNLTARILADVLSTGDGGLFVAFIQGQNYDKKMVFTLDPNGAPEVEPDEVSLTTYDEAKWGIWTSFRLRERRELSSAEQHGTVHVTDQKLDVSIDKSGYLRGKANTTAVVRGSGVRVVPFNLFSSLRVQSVSAADGTPLPFIQEDKKDDPNFWIILPHARKDQEQFAVNTVYEGKEAVIVEGGGNFYPAAAARESWYPGTYFGDYSNYDITFRIPTKLTMVGTGKLVEEKNEGDRGVTVWRSEAPMAVAGFNFGKFKKEEVKVDKYNITVQAFANEAPPDFITSAKRFNDMTQDLGTHGMGRPPMAGDHMELGSMSTVAMMRLPLSQARAAMQIYSDFFGTTPYSHISITQQTACNYGQSWPELVYLPMCSFYDESVRHQFHMDRMARGYWEYVAAHEVAHQWWGHTVGFGSYRDQWMSEGFSHFSASLFIQATNKDSQAFLKFWNDQREILTDKNQYGFRPVDVGPVTLGYRIGNSRSGFDIPGHLIYPKGGYILHMLRMLMWDARTGDAAFKEMMHDFVRTYQNRPASTEDFKQMVEKHMTPTLNVNRDGKLDWFFNEWVYGTALPSYKLDYSMEGKTLVLKATQSNVDDSFVMPVPVYLELDNERVMRLGHLTLRGNTSSEQKVDLSKLSAGVKRAVLNYYDDVLAGN